MKHITEEYGSPCNLLEISNKDLAQLEPFLKQLGVRVRSTMGWSKDGEYMSLIQAENVYYTWNTPKEREQAKTHMTDFAISCYKR